MKATPEEDTPIIKHVLAALLLVAGLLPVVASAQVAPPKPGVPLPEAYIERITRDPGAYQMEKAWIGKARRARAARNRLLSRVGRGHERGHSSSQMRMPEQTMVAGTIRVPVILLKYANTVTEPFAAAQLQQRLFDGPNVTGTVTELYNEMSYGNLTMTGDVHGWVQVAQDDTYYEGGRQGLDPCISRTGELIEEALIAMDGTVDFGMYDNDGPDGVPNSGDDDGFVDVLTIAHPEVGGECGTTNMWAHRWVLGGWRAFGAQYAGNCNLAQQGSPWSTNDARSGGGTIRIWDYVIVPGQGSADGCGTGISEIGVFAHEFGHALGLPDLYDTNGGGQGIGFHGLMGSGNWNTPSNPPHITAWSKMELGWVTPTEIGDAQTVSIANINQNPTAYKLNVNEKKFDRQNTNPISGGWSLKCGLNATEAGARNWPGQDGYGNGWNETVEKDFAFDGSTPVTLEFDVFYQLEANYDFARVKIDVNGSITELASYTGFGAQTGQVIDLTPHLQGAGVSSYTLVLEFESDQSWSDEDGFFDSGPASPFKLDDIRVTGGGVDDFSDFETSNDGWIYTTSPKEFFLVENRGKTARFDQGLRSEGLYIWHIEQNVAHSSLLNTGGTSGSVNLRPAGVTLMEADGRRDLLVGRNRGDAGDGYPGSSNNRQFDNASNPDSRSHNLLATEVSVINISNPSSQMSATLQGAGLTQDPTPGYPVALDQNVPNPFNPITTIGFSLSNQTVVSLNVYDVKGRLVTTLVNEVRAQGPHSTSWDGTDARGNRVASGVYFYQLRAEGQRVSKKMLLLR